MESLKVGSRQEKRRQQLTKLLLDLQIKLAKEALAGMDSKKISDLTGLLKADATAAKVFADPKKEAEQPKRNYQELVALVRQEYGIVSDSS